jgi:tetratricopeptide (TPR) repeat protein
VFSFRQLRTIAAALALSTSLLGAAHLDLAFAQGPAPTPEQMDAAKKAFNDGKALYDQKKLAEATEKFKEAYKLSKKPLLLYYVGLSLDESGNKELALFYYKKFMTEAPATVEQRKDAAARIKVLDAELFSSGTTGGTTGTSGTTGTGGTGTTTPADTTKPVEKPPVATKIKPAGTYSATDVQHAVVEDAPPGKPLDLTAVVPEDSGWTVTLNYRPAGEEKFITKTMRKRYNELVARIPIDKIKASSVHYYIEVKDQAGTVIDRKGKPSSPNIIYLDAAIAARFYPDFTDQGAEPDATATTTATTASTVASDNEEDPLSKRATSGRPVLITKPVDDGPPLEEGKRPSKAILYGTTGAAAGFLAIGTIFYVRASNATKTLEDESCKQTPCTKDFDPYLQGVQSDGKRDATISQVTLGLGVVAAGVAGYFWYKDLKAKKSRSSTANTGSTESMVLLPTVNSDYAGAAALWSF